MAKQPKEEQTEAKGGTERILSGGKLHFPKPPVEKAEAAPVAKPVKKPDPNKPKDVNVTSKHLVKVLARSIADNRMVKLVELARRNNDVKWLLAEYQTLSKSK
jgi:hypothetical protein